MDVQVSDRTCRVAVTGGLLPGEPQVLGAPFFRGFHANFFHDEMTSTASIALAPASTQAKPHRSVEIAKGIKTAVGALLAEPQNMLFERARALGRDEWRVESAAHREPSVGSHEFIPARPQHASASASLALSGPGQAGIAVLDAAGITDTRQVFRAFKYAAAAVGPGAFSDHYGSWMAYSTGMHAFLDVLTAESPSKDASAGFFSGMQTAFNVGQPENTLVVSMAEQGTPWNAAGENPQRPATVQDLTTALRAVEGVTGTPESGTAGTGAGDQVHAIVRVAPRSNVIKARLRGQQRQQDAQLSVSNKGQIIRSNSVMSDSF